MKVRLFFPLLIAAFTGISQLSFAQACANVNITSLSQNYLPLYHQAGTGEGKGYAMSYGPFRVTASNAYQKINGTIYDCGGEGAFAGPTLNYVQTIQDVYTNDFIRPEDPFPIGAGYNDYYWTVYQFC